MFGFLKILSESIKHVLRNVKLIASITALSLLLTSILFLLFSFSFQSFNAYMTNSITSASAISVLQTIILFTLLLAVEFTFMFSYIAIAHVSGIAAVLATAADSKSSLQDLLSRVKTKWRSPFKFRKNSGESRKPMLLISIAAVALAFSVPAVIVFPNPVTITVVGVVGVSIFVFNLHASVVWSLTGVITVVEDGCEAAEAAERAEKLVEGQRVHGFMVNLLFGIVGLIGLLGFWMIVGDQGSLNVTAYGLFFLNCASATRIFVAVVYTVYYFRCREYHGEQIQLVGNFSYTTLLNYIP